MKSREVIYWSKTIVAFFVTMFFLTLAFQTIRFTEGIDVAILSGMIFISTATVFIAVRILEKI